MGVIEIIKFALTCLGSFITAFGFFAGFWRAYKKKVEDKIKQVQSEAEEKIADAETAAKEEVAKVREGSIAKTEKLEKRISALEKSVSELQKDVNANLGQRLASIEGTMKGMSNILNQIQGYFINHTPSGDKQ